MLDPLNTFQNNLKYLQLWMTRITITQIWSEAWSSNPLMEMTPPRANSARISQSTQDQPPEPHATMRFAPSTLQSPGKSTAIVISSRHPALIRCARICSSNATTCLTTPTLTDHACWLKTSSQPTTIKDATSLVKRTTKMTRPSVRWRSFSFK